MIIQLNLWEELDDLTIKNVKTIMEILHLYVQDICTDVMTHNYVLSTTSLVYWNSYGAADAVQLTLVISLDTYTLPTYVHSNGFKGNSVSMGTHRYNWKLQLVSLQEWYLWETFL